MPTYCHEIAFKTKQELAMVDLTSRVAQAVGESKIQLGVVNLFVPGATGALTTIEYEPGLLEDFPDMLERIASKNIRYEHHERWHDGNGHSHVRASLIGPSLSIPIRNGKLILGTWQQITFIELDIHPRQRKVIVTIIGD